MGAEILSWKENPFIDSPAKLQQPMSADLDFFFFFKKEGREKAVSPHICFPSRYSGVDSEVSFEDQSIQAGLKFEF